MKIHHQLITVTGMGKGRFCGRLLLLKVGAGHAQVITTCIIGSEVAVKMCRSLK